MNGRSECLAKRARSMLPTGISCSDSASQGTGCHNVLECKTNDQRNEDDTHVPYAAGKSLMIKMQKQRYIKKKTYIK